MTPSSTSRKGNILRRDPHCFAVDFRKTMRKGEAEVWGWGVGQARWQQKQALASSNICIFFREFFWIFSVLYSTLLHLPPLFHCVGRCWDRTQDSCDFGIGSHIRTLTTRLYLIHIPLVIIHYQYIPSTCPL
jgi:hypothetical protein